MSYTVGKGVIAGLFTSSKPFMRTPKCEDSAPWTQVFKVARAEAALLLGTVAAIFGTMWSTQFDDPADFVWIAALLVMAVPYVAALLVALFSTHEARSPGGAESGHCARVECRPEEAGSGGITRALCDRSRSPGASRPPSSNAAPIALAPTPARTGTLTFSLSFTDISKVLDVVRFLRPRWEAFIGGPSRGGRVPTWS